MFNKKLLGLLIIPAFIGTINSSFAISNTASQILQATLEGYVDIVAETEGAVTKTSIEPSNGNLNTALMSKFSIKANSDAPELYLKGTTESSTSADENALFKVGGNVYVILSNLDTKPTSAAILDCKNGTPNANNNANAIAYPIADVTVDNSATIAYDEGKSQYTINAVAGETTAKATLGVSPLNKTYSFLDKSGTYQAILTLSTTSL